MQMTTRHNAVRAIIIKDGKLLSMHRNKFGKEYYTLIGGGVDVGETLEQAIIREVMEETGLTVASARQVFIEDGGDMYGLQNIFLCDIVGNATPALRPDSEEAEINKLGQNTYEPLWLPLDQLKNVPFRSTSTRDAILFCAYNGWPAEVKTLDWKPEAAATA